MTIMVLSPSIAIELSAQTLQPNEFAMGEATLGVPKHFNATFTNNSDKAIRMIGDGGCIGYADVAKAWLFQSDSSRFDSTLVAAGQSVEIIVRITPINYGLLTWRCSIMSMDSVGEYVGSSTYNITGVVAYSSAVTSSQSELQFGVVDSGSTVKKDIVLRNSGTGDAHIRTLNKPSSPFSIDNDRIWVIKSKDSTTISLNFDPFGAGSYDDTVTFGNAYMNTELPVRVRLRGSSGAALLGLVALTPIVNVNEVQTGAESTVDVAFVASSSGAQVLSASLRDGVVFSIASIAPLPASISPGDTLVVGVLFRPNSVGTFSDELTLTMAQGPVVQVVLNGTAIVSGVTESASLCNVHPNPAIGTVHWCSEAQDVWLVINTVGSVVATVQSDDQGRCAWTANGSGTYALRNVRSGEVLRVLVLN